MSLDTLNQDVKSQIDDLLVKTRLSSLDIAKSDTEKKDSLLKNIAELISESRSMILSHNKKDLDSLDPNNFTDAFFDRLKLNDERIDQMINNILEVIDLEDPVRHSRFLYERPNGLKSISSQYP